MDHFAFRPFYAGFGNRPTDVMAYKAVGVPKKRIFIINANSQIAFLNHTKTYPELCEMTDHMFPPLSLVKKQNQNRLSLQVPTSSFNDFNFWKEDFDSGDLSDLD